MIPAVILAAGSGRRMGLLSSIYRKPLLPVGDDTLLAYHLRTAAGLGLGPFVVVVDEETSPVAMEARRLGVLLGLDVRLVVQTQALGIGHAVLCAEEAVRKRPHVVVLGDTFWVPRDIAPAVEDVASGRLNAVLSVRRVEDVELIRKECSIEFDEHMVVRRIVEKPLVPFGPWKPCGVYFFTHLIFDALRKTSVSRLRNELELTDAIQTMVDTYGAVGVRDTLECDVNITFPMDLLQANLAWLEARGLNAYVHPDAMACESVLDKCVVGAGASVGAGARLMRVVVLPGASVQAGVVLSDAVVAPGIGLLT